MHKYSTITVSPVQADLLGADSCPLPPVQMLVDEVKNRCCGPCKQAGPLDGRHYPLNKTPAILPKQRSVAGQEEQTPPQLLPVIHNQFDSLVMSCHHYKRCKFS